MLQAVEDARGLAPVADRLMLQLFLSCIVAVSMASAILRFGVASAFKLDLTEAPEGSRVPRLHRWALHSRNISCP